MNRTIVISNEQRELLLDLLRRYLPGVTVWAYGSRVRGTARTNSDLDLVVFTTPDKQRLVSELKDALGESNLPFLVDLHVWRRASGVFPREDTGELRRASGCRCSRRQAGGGWLRRLSGQFVSETIAITPTSSSIRRRAGGGGPISKMEMAIEQLCLFSAGQSYYYHLHHEG